MEMYSSKFDLQKNANLEYILSLAGVSNRGKEMLMRDLNKMEEEEGEEDSHGESHQEGGAQISEDIAFEESKFNFDQ